MTLETASYRPLAHRLIRRIIVLATACALLLSVVQGVLTYQQVQQRFEASLQDIVNSNLPMLSVGIWDIEPKALARQINSIAAKPEIGYVRLSVSTGQTFEAGDADLLRNHATRQFDVPSPQNTGVVMGSLLLVARPLLLYQSLFYALLTVLLGYLLLTMLICTLVAYVLRREVEQPLQAMADFASRLTPATLTLPLQLSRPPRLQRDEIDRVAEGFATLQAAISHHISTLDQQVALRTQQLDQALSDIRKLSILDALTGCYNRAFLNERLPALLAQVQAEQRALSLLFCDADHFKPINDEYGHLGVDEVLRVISARLQSLLRPEQDWVVRFGGEEFVIVLGDCGFEQAMQQAEHLRQAIHTTVVLADGRRVLVSASFGVATLREHEDMATFLHRADSQLYLAKQSGRNCVMG